MDELDQYVKENELSIENIFKYVDPYSIYCHYIGEEIEIGERYSSPLRRGDNDPSFGLYFSSVNPDELMFKDNGNGMTGNVHYFVMLLLGLNRLEALWQINADFGLHFSNVGIGSDFVPRIVKRDLAKLKKEPVKLGVITRPYPNYKWYDYWKLLDISESTLKLYYAKQVVSVLYIRKKSGTKRVTPRVLCISYEINGYYKTYQPYGDPLYKFRNDYPKGYVEGGLQLRWDREFVIITKSTKECMFFREHFDWDACAGTSENSMISKMFMAKLLKAYKYVLIWLDNDTAGIRAQTRYLHKYPTLIPVEQSTVYDQKDPTDMYRDNANKNDVLQHIENLVKSALTK